MGGVTMGVLMRMATPEDAKAILAIYKYYITDTVVTFEFDVPTVEEFQERMRNIQKQFPWMVCEEDGVIIGYAYASKQRERAAYQWNAELSVYFAHDHQGRGLGTRAYRTLLEILTYQGYATAYGCITIPNEKSIALHERFGFYEIGVFPKTGYKAGKWLDVIWLGKQLAEYSENPKPPVSIHGVDQTVLEEILNRF